MKGINLEPVSVSKPEQFFNNHGFCGMRVNVCYAGDAERIMQKSDAVVDFDKICPFGARVINHNYDSDKDRTSVNYLFESGLLRGGHRRAHRFRHRVVSHIKYKPLAVVGCVPFYVKGEDGVEKSQGWLLRVVFSGDIVPPDMQGADVLSHFTKDAPEQYADKCSQITRVEYLFPDSMFGNNYKMVCRAENDIRTQIEEQYIQDVKSNQIRPVKTDQAGYYTYPGYYSVWRINVDFSGDITNLFRENVAKKCGLIPRGSQIIEYKYAPDTDTTHVKYDFEDMVFGLAQRRMKKFERQMNNYHAGR